MLEIKKIRCEYKENPIGIDVISPRISWQVSTQDSGVVQTSYRIQVCENDNKFINNVWDTGIVFSDQSIHIEYKGNVLKSRRKYYYRIQISDNKGNNSNWSETAFWEMGLLSTSEWEASWISTDNTEEVSQKDECSLLRNEIVVKGQIKSARIYATALGLYELYINGRRVDNNLFTPGWTSYNKRLQYQTYDATKLLNNGKNAIGAILGNGWYKGNLTWDNNKNLFGDKRALLFQIHIDYEDGRQEVLISDDNWKFSTGPILMSEIYHGETYDARLEKKGWNVSNFNDAKWQKVKCISYTKEMLVAQENVPVRVIEEINPIEIITSPKGEKIIDFGQNMVGWVKFKVQGEPGTKVTLKHAEVLDKEGNFYTDNLRTAKQTIMYILKGREVETYEPHFTFQGFRYVKIEGYPNNIKLENFIGRVIHSAMEETGEFNSSNELINKLNHNILWSQKGNFLDVPTDCPQRDERLGWTGDAQMFIRTACFNMNVAPFFGKWLKDLYADQSKDKGVPFVIPQVLDENSYSSSAWGDAATICPWTIYLCYGDKRILEQQYESMKMWIEYIKVQGENEYLWDTGFHFGDWLALDSEPDNCMGATPKDFIATAFYAYSTEILANTAKIINKHSDAEKYKKLYNNIIKSFRQKFVTPDGGLVAQTQTSYVLALMFNLVEECDKKAIADALVKHLEENNYHLTTGFVGTPYLCHALSQNGYSDIAYKLLLHTDYPSWLYQVNKGATTIWEHWDGIKEDGSFCSPNMNSFNHYAYGAIGDWLYRVVCGIDTSIKAPGYKHINICPKIGLGLDFSEAKLQTMYGEIKSKWTKKEEKIEINVTIPANTTATIILTDAILSKLIVNGIDVNKVESILGFEQIKEGVKIEAGSGEYIFLYF